MAVICDKMSTRFSGLNSVALNPAGDMAAVCFNDRELHFFRILGHPRNIDPSQDPNPRNAAADEEGYLEEFRFLRLVQGRYDRPPDAEVRFRYTKLAFLTDEIILVAREIEQVGGGGWSPQEEPANISLAAIRIETGEVVAEFAASEHGPLVAAPLVIPPKYVLLPAAEATIGLNTESFRKVFRLDYGGEQLGHNAIAYDAGTGNLYVLAGEFESSSLHTYRLHPDKQIVEEVEKRPLVLEGFLGSSLCLRSDGKEIAVWFTTMTGLVQRRTKKDCMYSGETGLLGRLGIFSQEGDRYVDVQAPFERYDWRSRDFQIQSIYGYDQSGKETVTQIGIRYAVEGQYPAKPFYLDDRTVVLNTPGGHLIAVDTASESSHVLTDAWSPIADLCVHSQKRLLLLGTKGAGDVPISFSLLRLA